MSKAPPIDPQEQARILPTGPEQHDHGRLAERDDQRGHRSADEPDSFRLPVTPQRPRYGMLAIAASFAALVAGGLHHNQTR